MKVYLKFLARNRAYTTINMVGLVAGLVFAVLLGLYVQKENSADTFHKKGDRIYKMLLGGNRSSFAFPLAEALKERYPEVESTVRMADQYYSVSRSESSEKVNAKSIATDSTFFTLFSWPLKEGDRRRQIESSTDVTISESFAAQMFGTEDPMGKELIISGKPHTVTGVLGTFPKSHLQTPDVVVRLDNTHMSESYFNSGYNNNSYPLYLLVHEGTNLPAREAEIVEWFRTFYWLYQNGMNTRFVFEPLRESYFNTQETYGIFNSQSRQVINMISAAVLAILLFALINYVNLSVALGGFRAKEAAMRQLLGASRGRLLLQYVVESVLFCAVAFVLALLIALAIEPAFNNIMGSDISLLAALHNPLYIAGLVGAIVVLGVLSGFAPALVITRVKPIDVVKGEFSRRTRMVWSRLFIGLQLCLTMVLVGCAITIGRQSHFLLTTDLGFDKSNLLQINNPGLGIDQLEGVRNQLLAIPGVEMVSMAAGSPVNGGNNNTNNYEDGRVVGFQVFLGDSTYMKILDLEVLRRTGVTDPNAVWLNEEAVRQLELAPDSLSFVINGETRPVAGVVRNFHVFDLTKGIPPTVIVMPNDEWWPWEMLIKVAPGNLAATRQAAEKVLRQSSGGQPVSGGFIDETLDKWYSSYRRTGYQIAGFSLLAMIISVMGLVAMTTYFMRQRRRDIAMRRVFGATEGQVLGRLVGSFMMQAAVAFLFAVPLIWWLMRRMLANFTYHVSISWWIFALAGAIVALVALAAVWWQSLAAARRNPVSSLKTE